MNSTPEDVEKIATSIDPSANVRTMPGLVRPSLIEFVAGLAGPNEEQLFLSIVDYAANYILTGEEVFFLIGDRPKTFTVKATKGPRSNLLKGRGFDFEIDPASIRNDKAVVNIIDITREEESVRRGDFYNELRLLGIKSAIIAAVGENGLLAVAARHAQAFSKIDEITLQSSAIQSNYVLKNFTHRMELEKSLAENRRLLDLTEKIALTTAFPDLLRATLQAVHDVVKGDTGSLMLFDDMTGELKIKAAFGLPKEAGTYRVELGQGISGWVAQNKKALLVKDLPDYIKPLASRSDLVSAISVPMIAGDFLVGVVNIGSRDPKISFSSKDIKLTVRLLRQAAISIRNSKDCYGLESLYLDLMKAMTQVVEARDPYSQGHSENVTRYSVAIASEMALPPGKVRAIKLAAMVHDVGYAAISPSIFKVTEPLSTIERALIKTHPVLAGEMMKKIPRLADVATIILHHHERFGGSGYAGGLKGEEIPLGSRILSVADAFDAMTSKKAYREAFPAAEAVIELRRGSGSQFDPEIVRIFCQLLEENPELMPKREEKRTEAQAETGNA